MENIELYEMQHTDNPLRKVNGDVAPTLQARLGTGGNNVPIFEEKAESKIRRLTPVECERLQGLPDNYTNVSMNNKPASDSNRYKAIGNGMAQVCADYVIKRIVDMVENR